MYFDKNTWRWIRLGYNGKVLKSKIYFYFETRNTNIPWVFSRYFLKLYIYQNDKPWIVPLKLNQFGYKVGSLGLTRIISRHSKKKKKKK